MTTTTDKIRVPMSERRPLTIAKADWPIIAKADWYNGEHKCQANYIRKIRVREHDDGRRLVYGDYDSGNGGAPIGFRGAEGGFLVPARGGKPDDEETVRAIRRVAGIIGDDEMGDQCIADMPAEEVDAAPPPAEGREIKLPREGALRLLAVLDRVNGYLRGDVSGFTVDFSDRDDLRAVADELRGVLAK